MAKKKMIKVKLGCIGAYDLPLTIDGMITYWKEAKDIYEGQGFKNVHLEDNTGYDGEKNWLLYGERLETEKEVEKRLAKAKEDREKKKKQKQKEIERIKKLAKKHGLEVVEKE